MSKRKDQNFAGENHRLAKALLGNQSGEMAMERLRNEVSQEIERRYRGGYGKGRKDKLMLVYNAQAAASAVTSLR